MIVYQIIAKGHSANFGGRLQAIVSKELYTSPPGDEEKERFLKKCIKCEGAADLKSLDPDNVITIIVVPYELIDNGGLL
ncbi:hypothetical protein LCGC14_0220660 [marine sediment metagenome]|uniref:Uncharacterized protein n=1 Tax=marine sediment metagenome TaxID=412755 RepID=A0A0F9XGZ6_9ZZZZ